MTTIKFFLVFYFSTLCLINVAQINTTKLNGVSFVNPARDFPQENLNAIKEINANWIAIIPFAFSRNKKAKVTFNSMHQWWGERPEGTKKIINYAKNCDLKIMIKPQIWMMGDWVGNFDLETEQEWKLWEDSYRTYIMTFAKIAAEEDVEIFCIGTEYKIAAVKREHYFRKLIADIKAIYKGKLVYAANWDNYENIAFWDQLDYIGIDSYFPLTEEKTPSVVNLEKAWENKRKELKSFSEKFERSILFTEYGYMSCDFTAYRNWENENNKTNLAVNLTAQSNAYEAFFRTFYKEDWFAGGFLWKWYNNHKNAGGLNDKNYTPQNKPTESVIRFHYGQ